MRVVFTFGRFNPPTLGHLGMVRTMEEAAGPGGAVRIFTTGSHDQRRNPLPPITKLGFLARAFPGHVVGFGASVFEVGRALAEEGFKEVVLVLGADRRRLGQDFVSYAAEDGRMAAEVRFVSRGDGAVSATQARAAALAGDFTAFARLIPQGTDGPEVLARDIYRALRSGNGE
jgi:hypothetical protein